MYDRLPAIALFYRSFVRVRDARITRISGSQASIRINGQKIGRS